MPIPSPGRFFARLAFAGVIALSAMAARAAPGDEPVRISGTGSGTGGMQLLAAAYMQANPGARIEVVKAMGSSGGINAVVDGRLELTVSNRAPNAAEIARTVLATVEYARTPFIVAVHRDLGITALTSSQLAALYAEGAATFPNGKRARPVLRLSDAADTQLLQSFSPEVARAVDAVATRRGMLNANTDTEAADFVEKTAGAFAVSTLALVESERRPLVALTIDGKVPSVANLANGSYPYYKALFLIAGPAATPATQAFAAYVRSAAGRELLGTAGHWVR